MSSLTLVRPPEDRSPSALLAVILTLASIFVSPPVEAQTEDNGEISSREVEPAFRLQAERNLVMVRVVVRDAKGAAVDTLRQEDFRLFDHGKLQTILSFSMEKPGVQAAKPLPQKTAGKGAVEPEAEGETAAPAATARRFVALYFDDVNMRFEDLARARDAADHFLTSFAQPGVRVALYTSSGQNQVDFTSDLAQVRQALAALRARPLFQQGDISCEIPPYEAYLILDQENNVGFQAPSISTNQTTDAGSNQTGDIATAAAIDQIMYCNFPGDYDPQHLMQAQLMVQDQARESLSRSETQVTAVLQNIESATRRMMSLPGQRSMVIISGGFQTDTLLYQLSQVTDRALRAGVILNAVDARGLYTMVGPDSTIPDASQRGAALTQNPITLAQKSQMLAESARRQTDAMQTLALETGGVFFNNSNDLEAGLRKTTALTDAFYVLAFSPQNLKLDGSFHPIHVKLALPKGFSVQARRGYYAPKKPTNPNDQEKEEIAEAVFSQDETRELPIDVHTQFFTKSESEARVTVLTRVDLRPLHFRKDGGRNLDNLTFVTVMFDRDGHVVRGQQKSVELHLRDSSLERYLQSGITVRTLFDVRPGTYQVRAVVRESESGQISGLNRTVEIPY